MSSPSAEPHQWNAADYARSSAAQQLWARELIAKLNLAGQERVLDIGCGDGKVTAELAAAVPQGSVLGVDSSPDMVAHARAAFAGVPNLAFERRDARDLALPADTFDVAFSNAALHWVVDHRPVLRGIAVALVPGGRTLLQMGGQGNAADILTVVERVSAAAPWREYFTGFTFPYGFYSPDDYRPWLTEAGLRPLRLELIPKQMMHADRAAFTAWIRTTWLPWSERVPGDRRIEFIEEVVDAYTVLRPPDEQGRYAVRMVRLEVEAVKR